MIQLIYYCGQRGARGHKSLLNDQQRHRLAFLGFRTGTPTLRGRNPLVLSTARSLGLW